MRGKKQHRKASRVEQEVAYARQRWSEQWNTGLAQRLCGLLRRTRLRVSAGELVLLDGTLYVTHAGLLAVAHGHRCASIHSEILDQLSRPQEGSWVVRATVFKTPRSNRGFVGLGDANPGNVSPLVRGSELRVAETRAVNRALRKAYAIGICSAEELPPPCTAPAVGRRLHLPKLTSEKSAQTLPVVPKPSVQDRLKLILRDHQLDPEQVLRYACRFLEIPDIKRAPASELSRFADHLEQLAIASPVWLLSEMSRDDGTGARHRRNAGASGEAA